MTRRRAERGAALVELAVATPMLIILMIGVVDFARAFYMAMELTNAARAGAQTGSRAASGVTSLEVKTAAESAAPQIWPYTVNVNSPAPQTCACITTTGGSTAQSCTTPCGGGTYLAVFVTVTASKQFSTIMTFPGIPSTINLVRGVTMRAQ